MDDIRYRLRRRGRVNPRNGPRQSLIHSLTPSIVTCWRMVQMMCEATAIIEVLLPAGTTWVVTVTYGISLDGGASRDGCGVWSFGGNMNWTGCMKRRHSQSVSSSGGNRNGFGLLFGLIHHLMPVLLPESSAWP